MAKKAEVQSLDYDFSKLILLHKKVAGRYKQYETQLASLPPLDVLNELRYALRAIIELLEFIQNKGEQKDEKFKHAEERAHHALLCAYNDLVDGLFIDLTDFIAEVTKNYIYASVQVLGERRIEIIEFLNDVGDKIVESRRKSNADERYRIYDETLYDEWFEKLIGYKKFLFETALPEIASFHEQREQERIQREEEVDTHKKYMKNSLFVAGISVLFGLIGIIVAIFK